MPSLASPASLAPQETLRVRPIVWRAFTLVELLVVVAVVALLISILLPALQQARRQTRLTVCTSNLRSQGQAIQTYTVDFGGALPPKHVWHLGRPDGISLINRFLADYTGSPFERRGELGDFTPTGIWRCPNVGVGEDADVCWTHSGILHHAPNLWLFNNVMVVDGAVEFDADALPGWTESHGGRRWRRVERVRWPDRVIALMGNVSFTASGHGADDRQARETLGHSSDVVYEAGTLGSDNRGHHDALGRRPAVFVDGHAGTLPIGRTYWKGHEGRYRPKGGGDETVLYEREVEHFMWFIGPGDYTGPE